MTDQPTAGEHADQLDGIADRAVGASVPARPAADYYTALGTMRSLRCVTHADVVEHATGYRLRVDVDREHVPSDLLSALATHGMALDPDRTASRPGQTVVIAE